MRTSKVVPPKPKNEKYEQLDQLIPLFPGEALLPYQQEARALAEVRIRKSSQVDSLVWAHHRAMALVNIVEEMAASDSPNETPKEHLATVMGIIAEEIEVAKWIERSISKGVLDVPGTTPSSAT